MGLRLKNDGRTMQLILREKSNIELIVPRVGVGTGRLKDELTLDILGPGSKCDYGIVAGEGMSGLYHVDRTQVRKSYAYQQGSTLGANPRAEERLPAFNLIVMGRSIADLERLENLLWKVLSLKWDCYLRMYSELSGWREIKLRLLQKPDDAWKNDPGSNGNYSLTWEIKGLSVDPFWYSEELSYELTWADMVDNGDGTRTGFIPAINPADEDCYPMWGGNEIEVTETWTLPDSLGVYTAKTAPTPGQIGDPVTHTLPPLGPGKEFVVDTYPDMPRLLVRDGSLEWANMHAEDFEFVLPPGLVEPAMLPVTLAGGNSSSAIKLYLRQRWDRFMGGEVTDAAYV